MRVMMTLQSSQPNTRESTEADDTSELNITDHEIRVRVQRQWARNPQGHQGM
jgi:hypothetical protein